MNTDFLETYFHLYSVFKSTRYITHKMVFSNKWYKKATVVLIITNKTSIPKPSLGTIQYHDKIRSSGPLACLTRWLYLVWTFRLQKPMPHTRHRKDSSLLKRYRKWCLQVNAIFSNGTFNSIHNQPTFIRLIPCSAQRASTNLTYIGSSQLLAKMHKWAWRLQLQG